MNKKQLQQLVDAIVLATANAASTVMSTTEDEARTLVGMRLRRLSNGIVAESAGVDDDAAKEHLTRAVATVAAEIAAKKKEAKAKKAEANADEAKEAALEDIAVAAE